MTRRDKTLFELAFKSLFFFIKRIMGDPLFNCLVSQQNSCFSLQYFRLESELRREDRAWSVTPRLIKTWKREESKAGIMSCMVKAFGVDLLIGSLLKLCEDIAIVLSPLLLKWLLNFIRCKEESLWHGFVIVMVMFLVSNAQTLFGAARMDQTIIIGLKVRSALTSMIYQKAFRLQNAVIC